MPDINKVKRNIKKMVDAGAPEGDINSYLSMEGVTIEDLQNKASEPAEIKQVSDGGGTVGKDLAVAAGVIGGAELARRKFFEPSKKIKGLEVKLDDIKQNYLQEPFVASQDVPSLIQQKGALKQRELKSELTKEKISLSDIAKKQKIYSSEISRKLNNFDNDILSKSVDELGNELKSTFPKFLNDTYKNYGKVLEGAELKLISTGKQLNTDDFVSKVLNKTIDDSIAVGVPEEKLSKLIKFRNDINTKGESLIVGIDDKPMKIGEPVSVKQLKGNVRFLGEDIPKEATFKLKENWGNFLETNAPEVSDDLFKANKGYRKVAQMRNAIYKVVDPQTGEFSKDKLNRMLYSYAKSNVETGLQETINLIAQGNEIASPAISVKQPFEQLKSSKAVRKGIVKSAVESSRIAEAKSLAAQSKINEIQKKVDDIGLETAKWSNKADKLLSQQKQIATKHPIRSGGIGQIIRKAGGVAERAGIAAVTRGALRAVPYYTMIRDAVTMFSDPIRSIAGQMGVEIPAKGTKERAVIENFIDKKEIPEEMNVTEKEKRDILINYGAIL